MGTLVVSISGMRGIVGDGLDPQSLIKYLNVYADFIGKGRVVVGRDSRITGEMVENIVSGTLMAKGIDVIEIGICPTPTVQFTVKELKANGGIAISASHNPNEWNALKLLNSTGQFMSPEEHYEMINKLNTTTAEFSRWNKVGKKISYNEGVKNHVKAVMNLKVIDVNAIAKRKFKVVADCVNGAGAYVVPDMLKEFGCEVVEMNCEKTGIFPRNPEPLPENLTETMKVVVETKADLGIVVDPDVDRLVLITDKGEPFVEENTITQIVRFILSKQPGNVVINLSTTRAVNDVAAKFGGTVHRSAVGEANVVEKMKEVNAVIGGEGSGGVIYPELHYGRDALVGIALTLQHLTEFGGTLSELKNSLPSYFIEKRKIELPDIDTDKIMGSLKTEFKNGSVNTDDGLRIDFEDHWVHFRKSNTEPIIRVITEGKSKETAVKFIDKYLTKIKSLINNI
jgi:phosphomannomutase